MEGIAGEHDKGVDHACQRGAEAADHIGGDFGALGRQTHQLCGGLTAAQGVDVAAEAGVFQNQRADNQRHQRNYHAYGDKGLGCQINPGGSNGGVGGVRNVDGFPRDDGRQAPGKELSAQRDDEGLHIKFGNQPSLHETEHHADEQYQQRYGKGAQTGFGQQLCRGHAGQRHYGADGDVNPADEQDEGDAYGGHNQRRVVNKQVAEHLGLQEAPVIHHAYGVQHHKQQHRNAKGEVTGTDDAFLP